MVQVAGRPRWRLRLLEPWRTRVLFASLAGNAFLVAVLAAGLLWPHRLRPPPGPGFDGMIERMARSLNAEDAGRLRAAMDRERDWYEMGRATVDEARRTVAAAVGREPFDPRAMQGALDALQSGIRETAGRFDESLVAAVGQLSPAGRAELAAEMMRGPGARGPARRAR